MNKYALLRDDTLVSQMFNDKSILITGATGYLGSHTATVLADAGYDLVMVDNFVNSSRDMLPILKHLCTCCEEGFKASSQADEIPLRKGFDFVELDIRDKNKLDNLFAEREAQGRPIRAVVHFAGLKSPSESVKEPLRYWKHNLESTFVLLQTMAAHQCHCLVFSSTAAVYAPDVVCPISETSPIAPFNPYGRTKWAIECLLRDMVAANPRWRIVALRYFNPIGAHPSGCLGENPACTPDNLVPFMIQVAQGKRKSLTVFGNDWTTRDGTGVRDYIHVMDLAEGHSAALKAVLDHGMQAGKSLTAESSGFFDIYNLGTGQGTSVNELIARFEQVNGVSVSRHIGARRPGDVAESWADPSAAASGLDWRTAQSLDEALASAWNFAQNSKLNFSEGFHGYKHT